MMFKNKKNNIINLSSKDLFLSIDYSKKINLDKLIGINSRYNFLDKKNNDLLKIKIEGDTIPDKYLKIDKVSESINDKLKFISLDFKQNFKKDYFKGRISIIQKKKMLSILFFNYLSTGTMIFLKRHHSYFLSYKI